MSATGILIILLAIWLVINADKIAWVFLGKLKLNTLGYEGSTGFQENLRYKPPETETT